MLNKFDDIKKQFTSSEWTKLGAKYNNPILSIFPDNIKSDLETMGFVPNKVYFFDDSTHSFKIKGIIKDDKIYYEVFIKNNLVKQKPVSIIPNYKYSTKFDEKTILIIIVLTVILVGSIILSGPIFKVLGWA